MSRRMERVNATLKRELGLLIHEALADPRVAPMTSVTDVDTSPDLSTAKVSVSVMGTDEERTATLAALESAAGFLRHAVEDRVRMRQVPRLTFNLDTRMEKTAEMMALMDEIARQDARRQKSE